MLLIVFLTVNTSEQFSVQTTLLSPKQMFQLPHTHKTLDFIPIKHLNSQVFPLKFSYYMNTISLHNKSTQALFKITLSYYLKVL